MWGHFGGMKTCWKIKYDSEGGDSFVKWKCLLRVNIIGKWARIWNMHRDISSRGTYWTLETWWKRGWFRKWRQICEVSVERKNEKKRLFLTRQVWKKSLWRQIQVFFRECCRCFGCFTQEVDPSPSVVTTNKPAFYKLNRDVFWTLTRFLCLRHSLCSPLHHSHIRHSLNFSFL